MEKDGLRLTFGKGPAARLGSGERVRARLPVTRIGAPLEMRATTGQRGMNAVLGARVTDAGRNRLLWAERNGTKLHVAIVLRENATRVLESTLDYG